MKFLRNMNNKKNPRAFRDILIYTIGSVLRQLVGFIMLPIYTTYLTPADYGVVSLLGVSIAIFELVMGARFAQAIPHFYYSESENHIRNRILSTALTITSLFSIVGVIGVWLIKDPLAKAFFGNTDFSLYLAVYGILLFTTGVENFGLMYLRILEKPIVFVLVSLLKLVVQLSLNIYLIIVLEYGIMGVIISAVVSSSIFCVIFLFQIYKRCGISVDKKFMYRLFKYTWPLWLGGAASLYIYSSNRYFIRMFSGLDDVGLFGLAEKFSMILGVLVWQPFGNWWQTERFKILNNSSDYKTEFQKIFDIIVTVMVIAVLSISLFSEIIINIMSAEEFHSAYTATAPLAFGMLFFDLSLFFNLSFLAKERTIAMAYLKYISAIVVTAFYLFLIPQYGFLGASYAILATNIILFLSTYYLGKRILDLGVAFKYFIFILSISISVLYIDNFISTLDLLVVELFIYKSVIIVVFIMAMLYFLYKNKPTSEALSSAYFVIKKRVNVLVNN